MKEMVGGCCVCSDERGWPDNPLVYCDGNGCTVAVHQACYGIVTVPTGPWYCRKCESPDNKGKVRCELCPSKSGALKRADSGGWAHVVCALYIPEVRFGNVTSMEPIVLRLIPSERYNKTCYICLEMGKSNRAGIGACMQCNKSGCKQQFHVTCAQSHGLLCEEAGNYLDNVKYCGYCQHHYSKLKKGSNVKTVPPYKPVIATLDCPSSDSSGEREGDASPGAAGSGTPTHSGKAKGGGRKSSLSGAVVAGKSTPNSKTPTNASQAADTSSEAEGSTGGRKHRAYKHKRKNSPARRGSSAGDSGPAGSGGSKASTPTPSPQHVAAETERQGKGGSTPSGTKAAPAAASPASPAPRPDQGSVISSGASAATCSVVLTPVSTTAMTSVLQTTASASKPAAYQESVITNTEAMENRQTKKRKAAAAATGQTELAGVPGANAGEAPPPAASMWESCSVAPPDSPAPFDAFENITKKTKYDGAESSMTSHYTTQPPPPPPLPPPTSHSPSQPSPRHLPSPMPGPSGVSQPSTTRSTQPQIALMTRLTSPASAPSSVQEHLEAPPSLVVSVPLPAIAAAHNPASIVTNVLSVVNSLPHYYHHQQQATLEQRMSPLAAVAQPCRNTWPNINVYEMQQDASKQGGTAVVGSKDGGQGPSTMRGHKKRAAMDRAAAAIHNTAHHSMQIPGQQPQQAFSAVRRPEPTPPLPPPPLPPVYQENIKESPPDSPSSEKPLKPKGDTRGVATGPHMLGNELNPMSGAAARLQQQLNAELCAHAHGQRSGNAFVPPPLINKGAGSSRGTPSGAQSLDQLLERQWEQGSQFLMEQAQHFDIASLLSCLHQLRTENVRLEEHVCTLLQRRDHLLAVNARLAIPLTAPTMSLPSEQTRGPRENGQLMRAPPPPSARDPSAGPHAREPAAGPHARDSAAGPHARETAAGPHAHASVTLERTHQQTCTPQERTHQMQMVRDGQQKPS